MYTCRTRFQHSHLHLLEISLVSGYHTVAWSAVDDPFTNGEVSMTSIVGITFTSTQDIPQVIEEATLVSCEPTIDAFLENLREFWR